MTHYTTVLDSPVGGLRLVARDDLLTDLIMLEQRHQRVVPADAREVSGAFKDVADQLRAYFAGELAAFDVPLELSGTDFQREVWAGLRTIPYGTTLSYAGLAERVGRPTATRAVGLANGRNPIAIIVPCHRVIGADGSLTGYNGGVERKRWLLERERALEPASLTA